MTIKIPAEWGKRDGVEAVKDAADADSVGGVEEQKPTDPGEAIQGALNDPVARIASQLANGTLSKGEAIDQLLAHTMGGSSVKIVPESIKAEIEEVLRAMLETDPHLKSLVAALPQDPKV